MTMDPHDHSVARIAFKRSGFFEMRLTCKPEDYKKTLALATAALTEGSAQARTQAELKTWKEERVNLGTNSVVLITGQFVGPESGLKAAFEGVLEMLDSNGYEGELTEN